jgi:anti-sigma factor RsiW
VRNVDDLTMYVYGLLDGPQERAMHEHVATCAACAELSERIGAEHRLLEVALARDIPGSADRAKVADEVLQRRYAPPPRVKRVLSVLRPIVGVAFIAGLFLLLFVSAGLPRPSDGKLIAAPPSTALLVTAEPASAKAPAGGSAAPAPALRTPEPGVCDLKIIMTWDARAKVDLDVQEPGGGRHGVWDHWSIHGLETHVVPKALPGSYRVSARLQSSTRTKVQILVILYEGSSIEERREETFVLEKSGDQKSIRDIVISR